jgi:hypothetical protein
MFVAALAALPISAQDYMVKVAGANYSADDLAAMMNDLGGDPLDVVQNLQMDEMKRTLAEKRGLKANSDEALYSSIMGGNLKKDRLRAELRELPFAERKAAGTRIGTYEAWLSELAAKKIPVRYLNPEAFWEMVTHTQAYQVRLEAGHAPGLDDWAYSWADLLVDEDVTVATLDAKPFVTATEYNRYCGEVYEDMARYLRRAMPISQARRLVAKRLISAGLAPGLAKANKINLTAVEIDRTIGEYVRRSMMSPGLELRGVSANTRSEYLEAIRARFTDTHADDIADLRNALSDLNPQGLKAAERGVASRAIELAVRDRMGRDADKAEVYEWMRKNDFGGSVKEARFVIGNQRFEDAVNQEMGRRKIEITLTQ